MVSQVEPAVGKIEALVADGKIGNGRAAQSQRETSPIVERRIHYLIAAEAAGSIAQGGMANFAAPAFDQGDGQRVGGGRRKLAAQVAIRRRRNLFTQVFS